MIQNNRIGIACDHAGYEMKEFVVGYLDQLGYDVHDFGTHSPESCDYADFAHPLAFAIENGELPRGIALCGSGNGITMTLNKHQAIRAAVCWTPVVARMARLHNDANICTLPARFVDNTEAIEIVDQFLAGEFEGGRHLARLKKMPVDAWEKMQKGGTK